MRISDWSSTCALPIYGHKGGDEVLIELAKRVSRGVRDIDLVSRYGGEEFVIVMPDADIEVAVAVAERVSGLVADQGFAVSGAADKMPVPIPIGVATTRDPTGTTETLNGRADEALSPAQGRGRQAGRDAGRERGGTEGGI